MKILHISNKPVYPQVDGGCVAMAKLLESLIAIGSETHHVSISTPKHPLNTEAYPHTIAMPVMASETFVDTSIRVSGAISALLKGENYNLKRFQSTQVEEALRKLVSVQNYDVIVLESLFLCPYITPLRKHTEAKIVVRTHNVEHELWEQQADLASGIKRIYLRSLSKSLKREEIRLLNLADQIWAITQEDANRFRGLGISVPVTTIPVAITLTPETADYSKADFFHLGSLNWVPNQLAVKELTTQLWPLFQGTNTTKLHIAGSFDSGDSEQKNTDSTIVYHGFVEDAADFMRSHGILLTPVRTGSGVRIKLLEALSLGVPCITTPLGAMGITDKENPLFIAETPKEWLTAMQALHDSEVARKELGERGRVYMEKYHSFATVNAQMKVALGT